MSRSQKQKFASLKVTNARRHLRKLELEAYASAVDVFRAQGVLTKEKLEVLQTLGQQLEIPIERHYAELRRALSDGDLDSTARALIGYDPSPSWLEEARKFTDTLHPFIPKSRFTTNAFRAISNYYTNQKLCGLLPNEDEKLKSGAELNVEEKEGAKEHAYHNRIHPLAAKILAEWGSDLEEPNPLSRSFLTPIGLDELTDVFPDQDLDFTDLVNPPLSPSEDVTIDNYALPYGVRRGTEPKTLSTKRRRCTSDHKSQTPEDPSSYESRRASDKNTPSNLSKIMQDYQLIMNLTKKKKVDTPEPSTDRRRKGKKSESITQESPILPPDGKNRSGFIVPCISIERIPLSQPKPSTPSPSRQQKNPPSTAASVTEGPKKPNIKRMKKKQLSLNISDSKPTIVKTPMKQGKRVKLKGISVVVSPKNVTDSETGTLKTSLTSSPSLQPTTPDRSQEVTRDDTGNTQIPEPMEEVTEATICNTASDVTDNRDQEKQDPTIATLSDVPIVTGDSLNDVTPDTQEARATEATHVDPGPPLEDIGMAEQTKTHFVTEQIVSEQVLVRRKKDSNTSLDIPSPDKIRNEMQSLYSPISSLDTPPDLEKVAHFELMPESIHLIEKRISRPAFSPITSPEETQSSDKEAHMLAEKSAERLSLILQDTSVDVLPQKCSLALSDIVEEVCESIPDPLSPSPSFTFTREESKPYTSPDSVFTDSSLLLSNALNSFMNQVISEDPMDPPAAVSDTTKELADLLDTQVLPQVEALDFAQISASLLSMDQLAAEPTSATASPTQGPPADSADS